MDVLTPRDQKEKSTSWKRLAPGVDINEAAWTDQAQQVLTDEALELIADLHRTMDGERRRLLAARKARQAQFDRGELPRYCEQDEHPEARGDWQVRELPEDLLDRRVEITGPVNDPKMVINMLSRTDDGHRADAAMLDFEDAMKPAWDNVMQGVINVADAAKGTLTHQKTDAEGNVLKEYALDPDDMPLLMVRVRGLHLYESNLLVNDSPVSAGIVDLVLTAVHAARTLMEKGKTPKYYVPKLEHFEESRWWNELFGRVEEALSIPKGTLRMTYLIETLPASFQMEEILYESREHAAGLNGGRWDKIFSDIKTLREHSDRIMADRNSIGMNREWMSNYAKQLIRVCHEHGAFAMGGMAPHTPGRSPEMREKQKAGVVEDKEFESGIGHDGCWVSHPFFIGPARGPFEQKNQLDVIPDLPEQPDLLPKQSEPRTVDGIRVNVRVAIGYMNGWLQDVGAVAWDYRMEDLATFEISRAQIWQWLHHQVKLDDGTEVTRELVSRIFDEEHDRIRGEVREVMEDSSDEAVEKQLAGFDEAREAAEKIFLEERFRNFLTCSSDRKGDEAQQQALLDENSC